MNQELHALLTARGSFQLEWQEREDTIDKSRTIFEQECYARFQNDVYKGLLFLGLSTHTLELSESLTFLRTIARRFTEKLVHVPELEQVREKISIPLEDNEIHEIVDSAPFMTGIEYLTSDGIHNIWDGLHDAFKKEIKEYTGSVEAWIQQYCPDVHLVGRIYFHLVENKDSEKYPFAFLATYSTKMGVTKGSSKHIPLKHALEEYKDNHTKLMELLSTVHATAHQSSFIKQRIDSGEIFHPLAWTSDEAFRFLKEIPLYEKAGILCRIPDWWHTKSSSVTVRMNIGNDTPRYVGIDALLDFDARIMLGDTVISEQEIRHILSKTDGLAYIKGRWVEVDHEQLKSVLAAYDKARKMNKNTGLTIKDVMQMQLGICSNNDLLSDATVEISHGNWLASVIQKLTNPHTIASTRVHKDCKATLRPYQHVGFHWLTFLHTLQFGACLADDMGLGKTIQVLAFLASIRRDKQKPSLLVVPASLIANWQHEIQTWTPSLKYYVVHGGINPESKDDKTKDTFSQYDIIITTYALVHKYTWLQSYDWYYVILDEAQAIKNPHAHQTRAVKQLKAYNRIVLTGTPIENRLLDLWSMYDFINPGLLHTASEFSAYCKEVKDTGEGYARLKKVITPYILRRLKTDKNVISDLPDKIEMKTYSTLTKKQVVLYEQLVGTIQKVLREFDEKNPEDIIKRKGIILTTIIKFKQICNHPDQYLGTGEYAESESGKFACIREILETIVEKREKVLIFTQFREIIEPLRQHLYRVFHKESLMLHGGTPIMQRKKIVERFQSDEYIPFFILSLKAGGVGLNLTSANHVIHFDRWWNPAVENQATDRVFRIGQHKKVIVHKCITKGTVEEKIDAMIEDKTKLSKEIIPTSQENWITELKNDELMDMFKLTL